jgi:hypothetical protein
VNDSIGDKNLLIRMVTKQLIRMVTKQTLVIIDAYKLPTLNKTVSNNLLSRITPYVGDITGDNQCVL